MLQKNPFNINEPLTESIFDVPEYATLNYEVAPGIPFGEINNVTGDNLKYKMHGHIEITRQTIFQYGPFNLDFSDSKRLPGSYRRSQFHPEHGITDGIRQHNVFVGQWLPRNRGGFFVCGGTRNYIQWNLYPRQLHSIFTFNLSLNSINPFMKLGFRFYYGMEKRLIEIVIDGKRKEF